MDVVVRPVRRADGGRLIAANLAARDFHAPWVRPFGDEAGFEAWWAGVEQGRRAAFLVEAEGALSLEAHVLDWTGDLYGQEIEVRLSHLLRGERRFDGVEALFQQIRLDIEAGRRWWEGFRGKD